MRAHVDGTGTETYGRSGARARAAGLPDRSTNQAQPGPCPTLNLPHGAGSVLRLRLDTRQPSKPDTTTKVPVSISYLKSYGTGNMGTATLR
jgi:hypothetical protein